MSSASQLETALRESVASEDYRRANRIWTEYRGWLEEQLRLRGDNECLQQARELVSWAGRTILASRALALDELNSLEVRGRYQAAGTPRPGIEVTG